MSSAQFLGHACVAINNEQHKLLIDPFLTGNDLAAIDDRLRSLVGRGDQAVRELVPWDTGASVWDVAEHVASGDLRRASGGLETLFAGGATQRDGSRTIDTPGMR